PPRQTAEALLRRAGRRAAGAGGDPGQRSQADHPRLGLPPGEPDARDLRARGRAAGDRLRATQRPADLFVALRFRAMPNKPLAEVEHLFTSESVTEGHPDKVADQVSDAVLDAVMGSDPEGRVACET